MIIWEQAHFNVRHGACVLLGQGIMQCAFLHFNFMIQRMIIWEQSHFIVRHGACVLLE
jgi:hypothetical protein